jgi:hypothetical protein
MLSRTGSSSANTVPGDQLGADHMIARCAIVILILLVSRPALAESLNADAARSFVVGKLFAFNCFDGSRGAGRIYGDGSVVGTIQFQGLGPVEWVSLPSGTLKVKGEAVCASLDRLLIEPCFNLNRIGDQSFRGSISGLDFAYCDFTRRVRFTDRKPRPGRSLKATAW